MQKVKYTVLYCSFHDLCMSLGNFRKLYLFTFTKTNEFRRLKKAPLSHLYYLNNFYNRTERNDSSCRSVSPAALLHSIEFRRLKKAPLSHLYYLNNFCNRTERNDSSCRSVSPAALLHSIEMCNQIRLTHKLLPKVEDGRMELDFRLRVGARRPSMTINRAITSPHVFTFFARNKRAQFKPIKRIFSTKNVFLVICSSFLCSRWILALKFPQLDRSRQRTTPTVSSRSGKSMTPLPLVRML